VKDKNLVALQGSNHLLMASQLLYPLSWRNSPAGERLRTDAKNKGKALAILPSGLRSPGRLYMLSRNGFIA
jgi:hypothetical protein